MNSTNTTWHDLADQLTADQRDRLANADHLTDAEQLDMARHYADHNQLQVQLAGVPAPAGAVRCTGWFRDGEDGAGRGVYGKQWKVGGTTVEMGGDQTPDGAVRWRVEVEVAHGFSDLNSVQARDLAEALAEAADELDRLSGNPYPVDSTFHPCCGGIGRHVDCTG